MSSTDSPVYKSTLRTKDLNQAAFIWCQPGVRIKGIEGKTKNVTTVYFVFELTMDDRDLGALRIRYANGETLVDPLLFSSKQSQLRDMLHQVAPIKHLNAG